MRVVYPDRRLSGGRPSPTRQAAGHASPALLDTYQAERRPVDERNAQRSLENAVNHFAIGAALGISHENTPEQNMEQLRRMWSGRPEDTAHRSAVLRAMRAQSMEFSELNVEYCYSYQSAAVVPDGRPGPGTGTTGTVAGSGSAAPGGLRAVRHVWVIELENQGYAQSFGTPSADPFLARTLPGMGALLENYYGIGHSSAANYVAQVSGQAPSLGTQIDCPVWIPFPGQVIAGPYHQVLGEGCVYPEAVPTLGNQLSAAGRNWAAYLQDMGNDPGRDHTVATARGPACGHPATWAVDHTQKAEKGDQYAARHDGFTFFSSVTANQAFCAAHIMSFRPLPRDLARASATPAFSFIAPDLCNDGHDAPCVTGAPGGLAQADAFLSQWVPAIIAAPAYRDGGLIVITFDEGSDSAACCGETSGISPSHPNVPLPGKTGPGGGRIGAVLLSPLIRPGTVSTVAYNHYSLLRSIEDIFGLPHLGDAAMPQVRSFGPDVFG